MRLRGRVKTSNIAAGVCQSPTDCTHPYAHAHAHLRRLYYLSMCHPPAPHRILTHLCQSLTTSVLPCVPVAHHICAAVSPDALVDADSLDASSLLSHYHRELCQALTDFGVVSSAEEADETLLSRELLQAQYEVALLDMCRLVFGYQASACLPHLASPRLTSPHLTSSHLTSPHLPLPCLASVRLGQATKLERERPYLT